MSSSPRHLVVRVDASPRIGTGYLTRCLALAEAWPAPGGGVTFVGRCEGRGLEDRVRRIGASLVPLPADRDPAEDLARMLHTLGRAPGARCVLDGAHHDAHDQAAIRAAGHRLLVIDDVVRLPRYHADLLLNQNVNASECGYDVDAETVILRGPRYALLRSRFLRWRGRARETVRTARRILVTMGGADADNVSLRVLESIHGETGFEVKIVAGPANPHVASLRRAAGSACEVVTDPSDMAALMASSALAVSAAGSTCLELACLGVPAVLLVTAADQPGAAAGWHASGTAVSLGWHHDVPDAHLGETIVGLAADRPARLEISRRGPDVVDGRGAGRVVEALLGLDDRAKDRLPRG